MSRSFVNLTNNHLQNPRRNVGNGPRLSKATGSRPNHQQGDRVGGVALGRDILQVAVIAAQHQRRLRRQVVQHTAQESIEPGKHPGRFDAAMAGQIGQERFVEHQVIGGAQAGQAAARFLRGDDGQVVAQVLGGNLVSDVPQHRPPGPQVGQGREGRVGRQRRQRRGSQATLSPADHAPELFRVGVGKEHPRPGLCRPLQQAVGSDDRPQAGRGMGGDVFAHQRRGVDAGKERRLPRGRLRQAGHAQAGVQGTQNNVGQVSNLPAIGQVENLSYRDLLHGQRPAQQRPQAGHGDRTQRVVRAGGRQPHPVEKDEQHPAHSL